MTYSIVSGDVDVFYIDRENGTVWVVREVDREITDRLTITIQAQDGGRRELSISSRDRLTMLVHIYKTSIRHRMI